MTEWFILLPLMILFHVIEDFHIQGNMAQMKQRRWWKFYDDEYRNDWVPVIILHGIEWAMFVSIPCLMASWFDVSVWFMAVVVSMGLIHAYIDHLKANTFKINLIQDQTMHMVQIGMILLAYMVIA